MLAFLKLFTFVGDVGQAFHTDWLPAPAQNKNAMFLVEVKTRMGVSSLAVQLEGSVDGDSINNVGAAINTAAPGSTSQLIITGLFPMMRVGLTANVASQVTISVYLMPQVS